MALQNDMNVIPADPADLIRWAMKESALLLVVVLVLFFYRRDFKNKGKADAAVAREAVAALIDSTEINTELKGQVSRLARAIEEMNRRRRPGDPPFRDPEDSDHGRN